VAEDAESQLLSGNLPTFTHVIRHALEELTTAALEGHEPNEPLPPPADGDFDLERISMASSCRDLLAAGDNLATAATQISLSVKLGHTTGGNLDSAMQFRNERIKLVDAAKNVLQGECTLFYFYVSSSRELFIGQYLLKDLSYPDLNIMCSRVALLCCSAAGRQASLMSDIFCFQISAVKKWQLEVEIQKLLQFVVEIQKLLQFVSFQMSPGF
jgi:hypothetical protein